jgi:hypothetical protein
LKDDVFVQLFHHYVKKLSDPKNRPERVHKDVDYTGFEKDIETLEKERTNNLKLVKPTPGRVLKTSFIRPPHPEGISESVSKVFINICSHALVDEGKMTGISQNGESKPVQTWKIPYSLTPHKLDTDNGNIIIGLLFLVY